MDPEDVLDGDGNLSIDVGVDVSRRHVLKQLSAASALVGTTALAGCQTQGDSGTTTPTDSNGGGNNGGGNASNADFNFERHPAVSPPGWEASMTQSGYGATDRTAIFVLQNIDNPFFIPMAVGFNDALYQFGWSGAVRGPPASGGRGDQITLIQDAIDQLEPGDAIVTTVLDSSSYNEVLQSAMDNDLAVINGHSTPPESEWNREYMMEEVEFTYKGQPMIIPHVGIRDARGGAAMAAEAYERVQQALPDQDEYTVFLTNDLPDNPSVSRRVAKDRAEFGTAQRYFEAQDDVTVYQDKVFNPPGPYPPEISAAQDAHATTLQGSNVDFCVNSAFWSAIAISQAIEEGTITGVEVNCGFDLTGGMPDAIQNGNVTFTVSQDPYTQGFLNVPLAWMWLSRGLEMKNLEFGVSIWDDQNVDFAKERRSWSELQKWQNNNMDNLL